MAEKRIIEINGIKLEVDMTTARRIDEFKVGDNVKVLKKGYSDTFDILPGVIVEFVNFKELPTMIIAMFKQDYSGTRLEFLNYNSATKDIEISACSEHELKLEKNKSIDLINAEIQKHETAAAELRAKRDYFEKHFAKYFEVSDCDKK